MISRELYIVYTEECIIIKTSLIDLSTSWWKLAAPLIGENVLHSTETTSNVDCSVKSMEKRSGRLMTRLVRSSSEELTHSFLLR